MALTCVGVRNASLMPTVDMNTRGQPRFSLHKSTNLNGGIREARSASSSAFWLL
jgi:hypothetical protein